MNLRIVIGHLKLLNVNPVVQFYKTDNLAKNNNVFEMHLQKRTIESDLWERVSRNSGERFPAKSSPTKFRFTYLLYQKDFDIADALDVLG